MRPFLILCNRNDAAGLHEALALEGGSFSAYQCFLVELVLEGDTALHCLHFSSEGRASCWVIPHPPTREAGKISPHFLSAAWEITLPISSLLGKSHKSGVAISKP